jgi:hypothetical protein
MAQLVPQLTFPSVEETVPIPVPVLVIVSRERRLKLAVQPNGLFKVTLAAVVEPLQPPLQPVKVEPAAGRAVNVTMLPDV